MAEPEVNLVMTMKFGGGNSIMRLQSGKSLNLMLTGRRVKATPVTALPKGPKDQIAIITRSMVTTYIWMVTTYIWMVIGRVLVLWLVILRRK